MGNLQEVAHISPHLLNRQGNSQVIEVSCMDQQVSTVTIHLKNVQNTVAPANLSPGFLSVEQTDIFPRKTGKL